MVTRAEVWELITQSPDFEELSSARTQDLFSECENMSGRLLRFLRGHGVDVIRAESPYKVMPNHMYLLVYTEDEGVLILDPTLKQFITNVEKLNREITGNKHNIVFATRGQVREMFKRAAVGTERFLPEYGFSSLQDVEDTDNRIREAERDWFVHLGLVAGMAEEGRFCSGDDEKTKLHNLHIRLLTEDTPALFHISSISFEALIGDTKSRGFTLGTPFETEEHTEKFGPEAFTEPELIIFQRSETCAKLRRRLPERQHWPLER